MRQTDKYLHYSYLRYCFNIIFSNFHGSEKVRDAPIETPPLMTKHACSVNPYGDNIGAVRGIETI